MLPEAELPALPSSLSFCPLLHHAIWSKVWLWTLPRTVLYPKQCKISPFFLSPSVDRWKDMLKEKMVTISSWESESSSSVSVRQQKYKNTDCSEKHSFKTKDFSIKVHRIRYYVVSHAWAFGFSGIANILKWKCSVICCACTFFCGSRVGKLAASAGYSSNHAASWSRASW